MIVGVGVDLVDVQRFAQALQRTPSMRPRLFVDDELCTADGVERTPESLAARFAAKEAIAKALGAPGGLSWHDCIVGSADDGRPTVAVRGSVARASEALGIVRWHLSLTHDGGFASAFVVGEGTS